jgi:hypothetical protein
MRDHDVTGLTANELEQTKRELRASLALVRPDSPARVPILAHISAIDAELAGRSADRPGELPDSPFALILAGYRAMGLRYSPGRAATGRESSARSAEGTLWRDFADVVEVVVADASAQGPDDVSGVIVGAPGRTSACLRARR